MIFFWFCLANSWTKGVDEKRNVLAPLAQGRQVDRHDVEPVEEIVAEFALAHHRLEVLVRRGDHAHIDLDVLVAADPLDGLLAQRAQKFHLRRRVDLADLIEENRAVVGLLEAADAPFRSRR